MKRRVSVEKLGKPLRGGFSLTELLVTIAIITILAGLILAAVVLSKKKGEQAGCLNNLRQLGMAFVLYHDDYEDKMPTPGSKKWMGPQPEDWIHWQTGSPMRDPSKSSIAPFISGFNAKVFRCPGDKDYLAREEFGKLHPLMNLYLYSYTMNMADLVKGKNVGMATYISPDRKTNLPFTASSILNPSAKILLVEEKGTKGKEEEGNPFGQECINDGRWLPSNDPLTPRHSGKASIAFADGHMDLKPPAFGKDPLNYRSDN